MRTLHSILFVLCLSAVPAAIIAPQSQAQQDDPTIQAATNLLWQTTQNTRNGRHNSQLRGLRQLSDPDLSPLYEFLLTSPHPVQRIHALLGLAEVSPAHNIDLARLLEIEDEQELTAILGAAIDDGLLSTSDIAQVATWDGLSASTRLIISERALSQGGRVDPGLLRESLVIPEGDEIAANALLHFGLAALMQMQINQDPAHNTLDRLNTLGQQRNRDAIRAQLLSLAVRDDFDVAGQWALSLASDEANDTQLRFMALSAALRFEPDDASILWLQWYAQADGLSTQIRLSLIALDAAPWVSPEMFRPITQSENDLLAAMGRAGTAAAGRDQIAIEAIASLIALSHPPTVRWARIYGEEHTQDQGLSILSAVISTYPDAGNRSRPLLIEQAILAVTALIDQYPEQAEAVLASKLTDSNDGVLEQIVLTGLLNSDNKSHQEIVAMIRALPEFDNRHAQDLSLLLRVRIDSAMSDGHWDRAKTIIRGSGQLDDQRRMQLAWHYLKHCNQHEQAMRAAIQRAR